MKRRAGLTLIEVLIVIAVVAVGALILTPLLRPSRARDMGHPRNCRTNLSRIGMSLAIYTAAYRDQWPWMVSDNRWNAPTGASQQIEPNASTNYNVSALLFMLVRDGQGPGLFICPSTKDTDDPNWIGTAGWPGAGSSNWDFSPYRAGGAEHISYSYQAPMRDASGTWGSGVTSRSDAGLVVLADKTPTYDGQNALFNWASPGKADPKTGMSQNHGGERINLLYADLHVGESIGRADVGVNNDNIYSCANSKLDASALPQPATEQGSGSLDQSNHISPADSFLIGPKKMDK